MSASATIEGPRDCRLLTAGEPRTSVTRISLLGCGTVGREVARALLERSRAGERGIVPRLTSILVRDSRRDRGLPVELFTARFDDILDDQPDVVIELLGGVDPATTFIRKALERGISVVTANKSVIARHGRELSGLARANGAALACEACVGAAVPVLGALRQLSGDRVRSIRAVLNGTCNFILDRMSMARITLQDALAEAVSLGLAEPDASADIDGHDAADKLCVLAAVIGLEDVRAGEVETRGIRRATPADIDAARSLGCAIRLIAELSPDGPPRVTPALVRRNHALAQASGAQNVFLIESERGGRLMLHGEGAGPRPTASAVLGDAMRIAGGDRACTLAPPQPRRGTHASSVPQERFYLGVEPHPDLNPRRLFELAADCGVEAPHAEFRRDRIAIITSCTTRAKIRSLSAAIASAVETPPLVAPVLE